MATIVKTPGTCGGSARIDGTRLAVWFIASEFQAGVTQRELVDSLPTLTDDGFDAAIRYALANKAEIQREIAENMYGENCDELTALREWKEKALRAMTASIRGTSGVCPCCHSHNWAPGVDEPHDPDCLLAELIGGKTG